MESIHPIDPLYSYKALKQKMRNPPNGRVSDELEVVPAREFRRILTTANEVEKVAARNMKVAVGFALVDKFKKDMLEWSRNWQGEIPPAPDLPRHKMDDVTAAVCMHYNTTVEELCSKIRTKDIVRARHVLIYLACIYTPLSLPQIGQRLGQRDHTSALHARNKIKELIDMADERITADVAALKGMLGVS
jgi:chromosomal replication initiation ATPase DnaA